MGDGLRHAGQHHSTDHRPGETVHRAVDRRAKQRLVRRRDVSVTTLSRGVDPSLQYPNGRTLPVDLSAALSATETTRICVTEEQYAAYGAMETCFELCKICSVNDKDSQIEPCGHFICRGCLTAWQVRILSVMNRSSTTCLVCSRRSRIVARPRRFVRFVVVKSKVSKRCSSNHSIALLAKTIRPAAVPMM